MAASSDNGPILVLGGTGFIGGYVARTLAAEGRRVIACARGRPSPEMEEILGQEPRRLTVTAGSTDNLPGLLAIVERIRPSAIVHLASNVDVAALLRDPFLAFQSNLAGAINVFEAARLFAVRKVIYFSSIGHGMSQVVGHTAQPRHQGNCSPSPTARRTTSISVSSAHQQYMALACHGILLTT